MDIQVAWGWQPALYLFLGGVGAGTFFVAGLIHLITRSHKRTVTVAMWCSIVFLAVGLGLLLLELSAPLRALMMWQSFSNLGSSWMAIGAWLLFVGIVCFAVAAVLNTTFVANLIPIADKTKKTLNTVFTVAGMIIGLCVAAYTGILLMAAPGIPFWNTILLPLLFTASALDTGVAFTAILLAIFEPDDHGIVRKLETGTICLIGLETAVLIAFISTMFTGTNPLFETMEPGFAATAAASASMWISGSLAPAFWVLLVVAGLAAPFALAVTQLVRPLEKVRLVTIATALCILVGGCTLRFITLMAGAHVDIVANTVAAFL